LYSDRPKILVPIAKRPFIEWQFEWLGRQGIKDIHLAGGYRADALQTWIDEHLDAGASPAGTGREEDVAGDGGHYRRESEAPVVTGVSPVSMPQEARPVRISSFLFSVSLSVEPIPLGTGGGLKYITPWLIGDQFLAINGDTITPELVFSHLTSAQRQSGAAITIAVSKINEAGRYGTVEFDDDGRITAFREKAERSNGWVNAGVYLIEKQALNAIPDNRFVSLETEIFPALVERGLLYAAPCPPPMLDMGTPEGICALEQWLAVEEFRTSPQA
jgi:NDP-sugar pyrophosphorylase family protein